MNLPPECLPPPEPDPAEIVALVARAWRVTPDDITGFRRDRRVMLARRSAIVALRRLAPGLTTTEIGAAVGRDHSTVVHHLGIAGLAYRAPESQTENPPTASENGRISQPTQPNAKLRAVRGR